MKLSRRFPLRGAAGRCNVLHMNTTTQTVASSPHTFQLRSQSGRVWAMGPADAAGNLITREQAEDMALMLGFEFLSEAPA